MERTGVHDADAIDQALASNVGVPDENEVRTLGDQGPHQLWAVAVGEGDLPPLDRQPSGTGVTGVADAGHGALEVGLIKIAVAENPVDPELVERVHRIR